MTRLSNIGAGGGLNADMDYAGPICGELVFSLGEGRSKVPGLSLDGFFLLYTPS